MCSIHRLLFVTSFALSLSASASCQSFTGLVRYPAAAGTPSTVVPQKALAGLFDADPYPDLLFFDGEESIALNDDGGGFNSATLLGAISNGNREGVSGDLNGDGLDDAVFIEPSSNTLTVLIATGGGNFAPAVSYPTLFPPSSVRLGDLEGDGDLDVAVNTQNRINFFLNLGSGTLSSSSSITNSQITGSGSANLGAFDFDDLDGDGDADIVVYGQYFNPFPSSSRELYHLINSGGSFSNGVSQSVNSGGHIEIAQLSGASNSKYIVVSEGNTLRSFSIRPFLGTWQLNSTYTASATIRDIEPGDFNGDGNMDVALSVLAAGQSQVEVLTGGSAGVLSFLSTIDLESPNVIILTAIDVDRDNHSDLVAPRSSFSEFGVAHAIPEAPDFRKVMLSEVSWGNPDFVEITNHSLTAQSLAGWTVRWRDFGTTKTSAPLTENLAPGESLVVWESGASNSVSGQQNYSLPSIAATSNAFVVALSDGSGTIVDEVRVANTIGSHDQEPLGGAFRGLALRSNASSSASLERIWGLDSNSGSDWAYQPQRSPGLENLANGIRGTDPVPVTQVKVTELDASPDYIELFVPSDTNLEGWFLYCSPEQSTDHAIIEPFPNSFPVQGPSYLVVGDNSTTPAELPASVPYVSLNAAGGGNVPWTSREFDCALYDALGRSIDLVRVCEANSAVIHNFPRAPSAWDAYLGHAVRDSQGGQGSLCRSFTNMDTNGGGDWYASMTRTMGSPNVVTAGADQGRSNAPDARIHDSAVQGGLVFNIIAGPQAAGYTMTLLFDFGHFNGVGPIFGLGPNALNYWTTYSAPLIAPFGAILDSNGSYRYDLPPGAIAAGLAADHRVLLQDSTGALVSYTRVLEQDH